MHISGLNRLMLCDQVATCAASLALAASLVVSCCPPAFAVTTEQLLFLEVG